MLFYLLTASLASYVLASSNGAPSTFCSTTDMSGVGNNMAVNQQSGDGGWQVVSTPMDASEAGGAYIGNKNYSITIKKSSTPGTNDVLCGFTLQAQFGTSSAMPAEKTNGAGVFTPAAESKKGCGTSPTKPYDFFLTHSTPRSSSTYTAKWTAPTSTGTARAVVMSAIVYNGASRGGLMWVAAKLDLPETFNSPTSSPSLSSSVSGSVTASRTSSISISPSQSSSDSASISQSSSNSASISQSNSKSASSSPSPSITPSTSLSASITASISVTASITVSISVTSSISVSSSVSPSITTQSPTISLTPTLSRTPSTSPTSSSTPSTSATSSQTATASISLSNSASSTPPKTSYATSDGIWEAIWTYDQANAQVTFQVTCTTSGWAAVGVSDSADMRDTEMYVAWVDSSSVWHVEDKWASSRSKPGNVSPQQLSGVSGSYEAATNTLSFSFTRPVTSNKVTLKETPMWLLWAYGDTNAWPDSNLHTDRGATSVDFLSAAQPTSPTSPSPSGSLQPALGTAPTNPSPATEFVSSANDFELRWELLPVARRRGLAATSADTIRFNFKCKTTGWCGLLLSSSKVGVMAGSDMYQGAIVNGAVTIEDHYGTGYVLPPLDTANGGTNDAANPAGAESNGWTELSFERKLNTGDAHDVQLGNFLVAVSYAYSTDSDDFAVVHTNNGLGLGVQLNFLTGEQVQEASGLTPDMPLVGVLVGVFIILFLDRSLALCGARQPRQALPEGVSRAKRSPRATVPAENSPLRPEFECKSAGSAAPLPRLNKPLWRHRVGTSRCSSLCSLIAAKDVLLFFAWVGAVVASILLTPNQALSNAQRVAYVSPLCTFALMLPIARNGALDWVLDLPFDRLVHFHRWQGYLLVCLAIAHLVLALFSFPQGQMYNTIANSRKYKLGLAAFCCLMLQPVFSLPFIRRLNFEVFYYSHFAFLVFFVLAALHSTYFRTYLAPILAVYLLDRLLRWFYGVLPKQAIAVDVKAGVTRVVFAKGPCEWLHRREEVGQYVFVCFPEVSLLQWHPFSISSGPTEETREIHIKAVGSESSFTRGVLAAAQKAKEEGKTLKIKVEGPYGCMGVNYRQFTEIVLVAGGIGITPCMGILKDAFRNRQARFNLQRVTLIWANRHRSLFELFEKEIGEFISTSAQKAENTPEFEPKLFITKKDPDEEQGEGQSLQLKQGRPDLHELLSAQAASLAGNPCWIFACGPAPLVQSAWDVSRQLSYRDGNKVNFVFHETFEL
eukprot:g60621.t1